MKNIIIFALALITLSACSQNRELLKSPDVIIPYKVQVDKLEYVRQMPRVLDGVKYQELYPFNRGEFINSLLDNMSSDLYAYEPATIDMEIIDYASVKNGGVYTMSYYVDMSVRAKNGEIMAKGRHSCIVEDRESFLLGAYLAGMGEGNWEFPDRDGEIWAGLVDKCLAKIAREIKSEILEWHGSKVYE